jgi:hypothetical protein
LIHIFLSTSSLRNWIHASSWILLAYFK